MLPKINSAHGAETRNLINRAIEVINRLGIDVQTLVAEGQLTPEQYSELIREVNGLIAKGKVKLDDLSPEILEAINNSEGTPFEILSIPRDRSVTPEKTTFIEVSSNLLNKDAMTEGYRLDEDTGENVVSGSFSASSLIKVHPNSDYFLKNIRQVARYDINRDIISTSYESDETIYITSAETEYIKVAVRTENIETAQINKGDELLPYEPFYKRLNDDISTGINPKLNQLADAIIEENELWEVL